MIPHFYPLIRSSLKKHFNTDFHLLGHNMVTKALMMLLFEMSKPFDLLLIFVMDNNSLFLFVFFFSCASVFPESPRWLLATVQIPQAKRSLQDFSKRNCVFLQDDLYPGETLLSGTHTHTPLGFLCRRVQFSPGCWSTGAKP